MTVASKAAQFRPQNIVIFLKVVDVLLMIAWPFFILFLIYMDKISLIGISLFIYFLLRLAVFSKAGMHNKGFIVGLSVVGLSLSLLSHVFKTYDYLLYYPVAVNALLFSVFTFSLFHGTPVIEKLARLKEPDLTPFATIYTRNVTKIWCLFFAVNGSMACTTALSGNINLWVAWNGVISYIIMGLLLVGELFARKILQKRDPDHHG